MTDDNDEKNPATLYEERNERIQETIDVLANEQNLDEHGRKAEVAREYDIEDHRITYVLNNWEELVEWRRTANLNPLDSEAVEMAYDDDMMKEMAEAVPTSDGGHPTVTINLRLDEAFRVMKLLPADLGMKVFTQVIEDVQDLRGGLDALFPERGSE